MAIPKDVTVILPVHNEEGVIESVVRNFYSTLIRDFPGARLILAEDGSTDNTLAILKRLNNEIPFSLHAFEKRKGYTQAFKDALSLAETPLVLFSDSDGQHDPSDAFKMLPLSDRFDIVSGYKHPRKDSFLRIFLSRGYNFLIFLLFGLKLKDIDSGFKLIKISLIKEISNKTTIMRHCVASEFMLRAFLCGYKITEIPVHHYQRSKGRSIFSLNSLPRTIIETFMDLFRLKLEVSKNKCR